MISTKGRYALRLMLDLAQHSEEGSVPLKDIAARQDISKKYLEVIVKELVRSRMISGISGKGGGYHLTRSPEDYTLGEILELMEGSLAPVACLAEEDYDCPRREDCLTLPMWKEYYQQTRDFFFNRKLSDLIEPKEPIYYI